MFDTLKGTETTASPTHAYTHIHTQGTLDACLLVLTLILHLSCRAAYNKHLYRMSMKVQGAILAIHMKESSAR